jgi:hypothetical protein
VALPSTGPVIVIGTQAEVTRLLELELDPAFTNDGVKSGWKAYASAERAVCTMLRPGWYCARERGHDGPCAAHPAAAEHDHSKGGHHD